MRGKPTTQTVIRAVFAFLGAAMALVTPTVVSVGDGYGNTVMVTWVLTTADHTGVAVGPELIQHTDLCWASSADTWGGATMTAQGANTNTDGLFGAMTNASGGSDITATTNATGKPKQQVERPFYMRPKLTTAGTDAVVTVVLCARRNQRGVR